MSTLYSLVFESFSPQISTISLIFAYTVLPRRYAHPKKSYLRCKSGGGHDNEDAQ